METTTKGEEAKSLFYQGYNCAQSVLGCFYREIGLSRETALLLASPFGGGMCRMREVCGAVSAMLMVLGMTDGYLPDTDETTHEKEKTRVYQTGQALAERFRKQYGSVICAELLAQEGADRNAVPSARTEAYYKRRPCGNYIAFAADLTAEYLQKGSKSEIDENLQEI